MTGKILSILIKYQIFFELFLQFRNNQNKQKKFIFTFPCRNHGRKDTPCARELQAKVALLGSVRQWKETADKKSYLLSRFPNGIYELETKLDA